MASDVGPDCEETDVLFHTWPRKSDGLAGPKAEALYACLDLLKACAAAAELARVSAPKRRMRCRAQHRVKNAPMTTQLSDNDMHTRIMYHDKGTVVVPCCRQKEDVELLRGSIASGALRCGQKSDNPTAIGNCVEQ